MTLVAGVDSSTQACKVVVRDAETGRLVREGRATHPTGTEVDPEAWWTALQSALEQAGGLDDVAALSVGGQQHGMVCLDEDGAVAGGQTVLGPGTGDNAAAALGVGAEVGDVVLSLGTSGVVSTVSTTPAADPSGIVAGFADATGHYLPLVVTLNAARVLDAVARLLGVGHDELSRLALGAPSGAGGLALVPYLEGERTPDRPWSTGAVHGLTLATSEPGHLARAAVEGLLSGLADGLDAIAATGSEIRRVVLVGGGARSEAVRQRAPAVLGVPVLVPPPGEYVADGAARQAAWVLAGGAQPPEWPASETESYDAEPTPQVRARYAEVRDMTARQVERTA